MIIENLLTGKQSTEPNDICLVLCHEQQFDWHWLLSYWKTRNESRNWSITICTQKKRATDCAWSETSWTWREWIKHMKFILSFESDQRIFGETINSNDRNHDFMWEFIMTHSRDLNNKYNILRSRKFHIESWKDENPVDAISMKQILNNFVNDAKKNYHQFPGNKFRIILWMIIFHQRKITTSGNWEDEKIVMVWFKQKNKNKEL
jgi:hypothetical protein